MRRNHHTGTMTAGSTYGKCHLLTPAPVAVQNVRFLLNDLLTDIDAAVCCMDVGTLLHTSCQQHDVLPYQVV